MGIILERDIPSFKAQPDLIPHVLRIIRDYEGDYAKIEDLATKLWQEKSQRKKLPQVRNSLRAVFGPTLRQLYLIRGEGDNIRMLPPGKELLDCYEKKGETEFKKLFAKHLAKLDEGKWVNALKELKIFKGGISVSKFLQYLISKYPNSKVNEDRLKKFFLYCSYVGLVRIENGRVELRRSQYEIARTEIEKKLGDKEFVKVLYEQFKILQSQKGGNPYIPIPDLRDRVCEKTHIWLDYFDEKLKKIPKETTEYQIQLTQPMLRKLDGISIAGKYLYYINMFKKGGE